MKKILVGLIILFITITLVISSNGVNLEGFDNSTEYAGVPPVKVPPIPPPVNGRK